MWEKTMTKDEALKLALDAFGEIEWSNNSQWQSDRAKVAITAIKTALEAEDEQLREENERLHVENRRLIDRIETIGVPVGVGGFATTTSTQPEQEPVGKFAKFTDGIWREVTDGSAGVLLYTTPQRTWVGLTDKEIDQGLLRTPYAMKTAEAWREGVLWAYQQLKEKNDE